MIKNYLKSKLGKTIFFKISQESELRLKFKYFVDLFRIFKGLVKCRDFHSEEKKKIKLIQTSRIRRTKEKYMNAMVNGLLMSLTLKRAASIIGFKMKELGFEGLLYHICD